VCIPTICRSAVKRAGIRRRNPYHTRHTFACGFWPAGANPSYIANQMGHKYAQIVYEIDAGELKRLCLTGAPFER